MDIYMIDNWKDVPTGVTVLLADGKSCGQVVEKYLQHTGNVPLSALKERTTSRFYLPIDPADWKPEGREPDEVVVIKEVK